MRNNKETAAELKNQIALSIKGVKQCIKDTQSATGVKDKITEVFVERVIAKRQQLKKQGSRITEEAVQLQLNEWLDPFNDDMINPFLSTPGLLPI